jgi:uncharacterized protein (TIGR03437 family)
VIQGGTPYTSTTASGGTAGTGLFPPTPTGWTLTDAAHDEQFQISVIDNTTRALSLTITQVSTGHNLATGSIDQSGTGTITYSDGSTGTITSWTLADVVQGTSPTIAGVAVSGGGTAIAQNTFVSIYGANLAPASVGADGITWSSAPSFASGEMPTELGGVSVTVNGKPAYISYAGTTQVNVLTPLDATTGPVAIQLNNGTATSNAFTPNMQAASPGFLRFNDGIHIAAEHADYSLLGPASLSVPGYTFTPATPGETITLYADGFGLPVTTLTPGSDAQSGVLATLPQVTIGGAPATVEWAGLNGIAGLYQINVTVPKTATTGDNQVIATYDGVSSPAGAMIPVW